MSKPRTLFSYFSPKNTRKDDGDNAKGKQEVLTPKRSPNDKSPKSKNTNSPAAAIKPKEKIDSADAPTSKISTPTGPGARSKKGNDTNSKQRKLELVPNGTANKDPVLGDLVWARLEGYPWWPGMITNHPTTNKFRTKGKKPRLHVQFFDDPPSRAWILEKSVSHYKGSDCDECKEGGRFWTDDEDCKKSYTQADVAMDMDNEKRITELYQHLPSTDEEYSDDSMDVEENDSKENMTSTEKTPSKSPRGKGRLPSRQAAKRRRVIIEDGHDQDSDDEFKLPKTEVQDSDSGSSGVEEHESESESESEDYSDIAESPEKDAGRKRKRGSSSAPPAKKAPGNRQAGKSKRIRIDSSDEEAIEVEKKTTPARASPWAKPEASTPSRTTPSVSDKTTPSRTTPSVSDKTKSRLTEFAVSEVAATVPDAGRVFPHVSLDFIQPENIKDDKKRTKNDLEYNSHTLYIPQSFMDKQTPAMRQWWDLKSQHFNTVLFFKMGKFYELFHMDASIAVKELGLIYMKGDHAHCGFPEIAYARYADTLIQKGYRVARIEQTETADAMQERTKKMFKPSKFDKVVRREVCRVSTKGTRTFSFIDGDTSDATCAFLLAIAEKEPNEGTGKGSEYGVCFVDTSIGEFHIGQFEDDRHCSRLRTLISHFTPAQVLVERSKFSDNTKNLLNNNLPSALRDTLRSGTEFWDSSKTLKVLSESEYFIDENNKEAGIQWPEVLQVMKSESDPLGNTAKDENDLALRALGAIIWYLTDCCLDHEVLSMRKFKLYTPVDRQIPSEEKKAASMFNGRKRMILDGVTLANLDILDNSSSGGPEGTLLDRLNTCATPFGKRLLKQWLCSPLCNPEGINDRLDAMSDLIDHPDVVAEALDIMGKLPDLERLLSKIHTLGSATRAENHPDGRAVFFEDLTYSKRKIEDLLSALSGFKSAKKIVEKFQKSTTSFKSTLLKKTTLVGEEGHFPDLKELLDFFESAFNQQKAKAQGTITPNKGVDPEYDQALDNIEETKAELDKYLEEQKRVLKCNALTYWGTAKNRFQLEVPESALSRVPDCYEVTSQKKGYRRYWTTDIRQLLLDMIASEERRDAALRDCLRKIFFAFDKSHSKWLVAVQCLAVLDVLIALSDFSKCGDGVMCRPEIVAPSDSTQPMMEIREGRNPCIARTFSGGDFIPNDTVVGIRDEQIDETDSINADSKIVLVTGPNMGGKSTLMRQVGVITVLAQLGCHVPAEVCRLTPVDRVFTRLGASDRIMAGESTFFVELSETSSILQHATRHSLVLLDELGRGTATYDGTAIACAVVQELSQNIGCRTLFSTHYHSLVEEFSHDPNVRLGHMACMVENDNEEEPGQETITFLYKFVQGACPKSYGFNAARLADIPDDIIRVAVKKAKDFEIATNKTDWFREVCRMGESQFERLKTIQKAVPAV